MMHEQQERDGRFSHKMDGDASRISPLFNDAFIRIFGNEASRGITRGLINSILRSVGMEPLGEIQRIDADYSQYAGSIDCKMGRVDVCVLAEDRLVDLEAQRYPDNVANRSVFYASQMICESMRAGMSFDELPQSVVITLYDTTPLFPDSEDFLRVTSMQWNGAEGHDVDPCTDRIVFILAELEKVRDRYTKLNQEILSDEALAWLYLLARGYEDEGETMEIAEKFPTIEEFAEQYGIALNDPKLKAKYRGYDMYVRDQKDQKKWRESVIREATEEGLAKGIEQGMEQGVKQGIEQGLEQGIEQGMQRGIRQGRAQGIDEATARIAAAMRADGVDEEKIRQYIGQ